MADNFRKERVRRRKQRFIAKGTGVVIRYIKNGGYGFITQDVVFHHSSVKSSGIDIKNGAKVKFALFSGPKGYCAENVKLLNWEESVDDSDDNSSSFHDPQKQFIADGATGVVIRYNNGYGFIRQDEGDGNVFFHQSAVKSNGTIRKGNEVTFDLFKVKRGYLAKDVKPLIWEQLEELDDDSDGNSTSALDPEEQFIVDGATGVVIWYTNGYGFIRPDEGDVNVFFHHSAVKSNGIDIQAGDEVTFDLFKVKRGYLARDVKPLIWEELVCEESDDDSDDNSTSVHDPDDAKYVKPLIREELVDIEDENDRSFPVCRGKRRGPGSRASLRDQGDGDDGPPQARGRVRTQNRERRSKGCGRSEREIRDGRRNKTSRDDSSFLD